MKIFVLISTLVIAMTLMISKASADFSPNYNPNNLIDNATLLNNSSMTTSSIQAFLANIGSGLANFKDTEACDPSIAKLYPSCGQSVSAAQIIYDASQAYKINPRAIIAELEKEQSLITDPNPSSSQLNCAMGYNSCVGYVGFFSQVDNGAWDLRFNFERANGNNAWWNPTTHYGCGNAAPGFYNNGLFPGNTVTFVDSGGTVETVVIANAATASLYCYTPYVGPYSLTGYSGNYNFVYYYQLWFGSTSTSSPYAWIPESQAGFEDSAHTQQLTGNDMYVNPGQTIYLTVDARNIGYDSWNKSVVHLGTSNPIDRSSVFYNPSWLSTNRIEISQDNIEPGDDTTISFPITAPQQTGTYKEYFNMVADGIQWFNDPGLYFTINVIAQRSVINTSNTGLASGQILSSENYLLSPDNQSSLYLSPNGSISEYSDGSQAWTNGISNQASSILAMQSDGNLVEYSSSGQPIWATNTSGNPGAYLVLQTDGNIVIYTSSGQPIWATNTSATPGYLDRIDQSIPDNGILFPGQYMLTANGNYMLIFQTDGNLVEYYNGHAIWSSSTENKSAALIVMQNDGNLVIYNHQNKPIWASNTSSIGSSNLVLDPNGLIYLDSVGGKVLLNSEIMTSNQIINSNNYQLAMQGDGNLVIYNHQNKPIWASDTSGNPGAYLVYQYDGNLVIYNQQNKPIWASDTSGAQKTLLAMQNDGNLVLYGPGGAIWASGTSGK